MIFYTSGGVWYLVKLFRLRGSVFPISWAIALPCGLIAAAIRWLISNGSIPLMELDNGIVNQTQAWAGFSSLVGFLIIFRTSQAYSRFWEGCTSTHTMRAEWFDACSALVAFCEHSKADPALIMTFKHTLVRLFSMLHASALADLEDVNNSGHEDSITAFTYELIDPMGIDADSLNTLRTSEARVEVIFEWIQLLIVQNISSGVLSIPPPILSRAFQEIANGMVAFHDSIKISFVPFPFPYAQNCDFLLVLHWCLAPFVISQWVNNPFWAFVFVFIQVFILWSLNFIAVEIENPFGNDQNDLDGHHMQNEMNRHLLLLLKPSSMTVPKLSAEAIWSTDPSVEVCARMDNRRVSFLDVWGLSGDSGMEQIVRKESAFVRSQRTQRTSVTALSSLRSSQSNAGSAAARLGSPPSRQNSACGLPKRPPVLREEDEDLSSAEGERMSVTSRVASQAGSADLGNSTSQADAGEIRVEACMPEVGVLEATQDDALAVAEGDWKAGPSSAAPQLKIAPGTGAPKLGTSAPRADGRGSPQAAGRLQVGVPGASRDADAATVEDDGISV